MTGGYIWVLIWALFINSEGLGRDGVAIIWRGPLPTDLAFWAMMWVRWRGGCCLVWRVGASEKEWGERMAVEAALVSAVIWCK